VASKARHKQPPPLLFKMILKIHDKKYRELPYTVLAIKGCIRLYLWEKVEISGAKWERRSRIRRSAYLRKVEQVFLGQYEHTIDEKGRMTIRRCSARSWGENCHPDPGL